MISQNFCKVLLRRRARNNHLNLDDLMNYGIPDAEFGGIDEVMSLPVIYREVVLMHYIEGAR